jgi:hypothetical protein
VVKIRNRSGWQQLLSGRRWIQQRRLKETEMLIHPDLALAQAHDRQRELIAEADRRRLLVAARRHRRAEAAVNPAPRGRPEGEHGPQGARVPAPAR